MGKEKLGRVEMYSVKAFSWVFELLEMCGFLKARNVNKLRV